MKCKHLSLVAVFSLILTPFAMAESAADFLFSQGFNAEKKGNYSQAAKLYEKACNGKDF